MKQHEGTKRLVPIDNQLHLVKVTVPIRQDGRIVIPSTVRQNLALENGDLVEIEVQTVNESIGDSE